MKNDLDRLMKEHDVDVLLVTGPAQHNPAMVYLTGGGHITLADVIKVRDGDATLFHGAMERDEAVKTGLKTISYSNYPMQPLLQETHNNAVDAIALRYKKMFADLGITTGKVAIYGNNEVGGMFSVFTRLQQMLPGMSFIGFIQDEILLSAMMTKGPSELERIREMGKITVGVVARTAEYLTSFKAKNEVLVHPDGSPITIGEVKSMINLWLAEAGAENPEGTIFAIGRDAGVPHSTGTATDALRLGQTIVYDIFPCEAQGGYFYDFTRTWCLGYAPDAALHLYEQVKSVYDTITSELKVNTNFGHYQVRTCELFEAQGHATVLHNPATEEGYVHSLGHGVGLNIHEKPWSATKNAAASDILAPGAVFTLEPGLYYPEKGMGVRIEDTLFVTPDGKFEIFVDYPKDLVLPVKSI
ncbi:MAG: M24 family metallopeptidase [Anaerolineaceae bacterium]